MGKNRKCGQIGWVDQCMLLKIDLELLQICARVTKVTIVPIEIKKGNKWKAEICKYV